MADLLQELEKEQLREVTPDFAPGDTVRVLYLVREGAKERIQVFEGVCIARKHGGVDATFTVRKISSGIGVERILAAAVELYNDDLGIVLPRSIAPYQVVITLLRPDDEKHRALAEDFYEQLNARGIDCLLDDRDERPGVKFKDAELIGIPLRLTLGRKLTQGEVEVFSRADRETVTVPTTEALETVEKILNQFPL